jgi:hypothetical protein
LLKTYKEKKINSKRALAMGRDYFKAETCQIVETNGEVTSMLPRGGTEIFPLIHVFCSLKGLSHEIRWAASGMDVI